MALGWLWWRAWASFGACRSGCLRGRRGTWWHRRAFCVAGVAAVLARLAPFWRRCRRGCLLAGVALGDIDLQFGVARVALGDIDLHFAWQAWHLATSTFTLRGRRGTWRHRRAFCVAGVALMALAWVWRGRRGTWRHRRACCVAGMVLGDIDLHFAWQAWRLATSTCILRGTWRHRPSLCVAGVALGDMDIPSAWQAWHLATSTCILRGRCGTCGAGLALVARLDPVVAAAV